MNTDPANTEPANTEPAHSSVDELLIDWEIERQNGTPITPEELCRHCPQLLDAVQQRIAEQLEVSQLLGTPTDEETKAEESPSVEKSDDPVLPDLNTQSKFRNLRFHAKGGLGEIWVAEDETLGRKVALKFIQTRHSHRDDAVQRFRRE